MATTGATLHLVALLQICKSGRLPSPPAVALMRRSSTPSSSSSSFRTFPHEKKKRKEKKTTRKEIPKTISLTLLGFSIEIIRYAKRPDLQGPNPRRTCGFRCSFVSFLVFSSSFFLFLTEFFFSSIESWRETEKRRRWRRCRRVILSRRRTKKKKIKRYSANESRPFNK